MREQQDVGDDGDVLSIIDEVLAPHADEDGGHPESLATDRPRVLVADDNEDYRSILVFLLTQAGCDVADAANGRRALELAAQATPELVITDLAMPFLNGYELLSGLRAQVETMRVPVIVVTGATNRAHMRDVLDNIVAFLEKPVKNRDLMEAVRNALGDRVKADVPGRPMPAEEPVLAVEGLVDLENDEQAPVVEAADDDSPVIAQVNRLLGQAVQRGASDIHIEPFEKDIVVRFRVNGSLTKACSLPAAVHPRLVARIKVMANLPLTEKRRPQDGRLRAKIGGKKVDLRVSTLPSVYGEKVVMRLLGGVQVKERLDLLGFAPRDLDAVERALNAPHGLILVTGPTGSGKSTTLYTMLRSVATPDVNVVTAEDPVEAEMPGITQVQVRPDLGFTFEAALRTFLRQDPDIMLVGEIRDLETAQIAAKAAVTGHLVLSTLHTNSAPATALRLIHMGLPGFFVAASLKLVVAQRLAKRLCPDCKEQSPLPEAALKTLTESERARLASGWSARGCDKCEGTGCAGRHPLFEVMPLLSNEMKRLVLEGRTPDVIAQQAQAEGMSTLRQAALSLAAAGEVSMSEALKVCLGD